MAPRVALWGALVRGCHTQGAAPRQWQCQAMPCHAAPCHDVGLQPHGAVGPGAQLHFPLAGTVKEALCTQPLPWPVRTSGSPA